MNPDFEVWILNFQVWILDFYKNPDFESVFWSLFGSFFLVFPSRRLSVTSDIQIVNSEAYSEPFQTSKMELFTQIVNSF